MAQELQVRVHVAGPYTLEEWEVEDGLETLLENRFPALTFNVVAIEMEDV